MDRHILLVVSEVNTTRAKKNKDLVSFHKRFECCFNTTVFEQIDVRPGMYATFDEVDLEHRLIRLVVVKEKPITNKSKWYKIRNPQVSKTNRYCYIRTTNLVYDFDLIPLGAFEYYSWNDTDYHKEIYIKF